MPLESGSDDSFSPYTEVHPSSSHKHLSSTYESSMLFIQLKWEKAKPLIVRAKQMVDKLELGLILHSAVKLCIEGPQLNSNSCS